MIYLMSKCEFSSFSLNLSNPEATAIGAYNPGVNCGPPVMDTPYDHLDGISKRKQHPYYPEPEVALIFKQNEFDDPNLDNIESGLKEAFVQVSLAYF